MTLRPVSVRAAFLVLTIAAGSQAAPLDKPGAAPKLTPSPIAPVVPRPVGSCLTAAPDASWGIGASPSGAMPITPRSKDKECPSSIIVDWTINPEAARPTPPPPGAPNAWWRAAVPLVVHDARMDNYGVEFFWLQNVSVKKVCDDFKQSQKIYRRAQNETGWTLVAEGTSTSQHYEGVKCLITRPNKNFRAPPPPANQKVYYRTVDTFSSMPSAAMARYLHDKESSQTE